MTRDQIIALAQQCGLMMRDQPMHGVERFAALVAAAEREACALTAETVVPRHTECGNRIAAAIRARGQE